MSRITDLADAVVTAINAASFSLEFTAARLWLPRFDRKDLDTLTISVVPRTTANEIEARPARFDRTCEIDLAVQAAVANAAPATVDPLADLLEELADWALGRALDGPPAATCIGVDETTLSDPNHLMELSLYTGVLRLTFRMKET